MIQGCIFDMDGLLFDTERIFQETWEKIAAERGIVLPPSFAGDIMGTSGEKMNRILETYYRPYKGEEIQRECKKRVEAVLKNHVPLMPGAVEILETCKALQIKTAVASSSPMEQIKANLSRTGTDVFFDALVSGEEVENGKPAPDIFLLAAKRIHVPPACCLVFEDSPHGIAGAAAGGFIPVMIPCLLPPTEENKKVAHIYKNLREAGHALLKKK